jgi:CDP-diacylglycerol---serine O-phosphatidyltransferase
MFVLPNWFTAGNLICGVLAIMFAMTGRIDLASWLVLLAALLDFMDGFLARKMGVSSALGKQLDSLADMVTFGAVPGIITFILLIINGAHEVVYASFGADVSPYLYESFGQSIHQLITFYFADLTGNPLEYAPFHFSGWYLYSPFVALTIPFFSLFRLAKFNLDTRQTDKFLGLPTPANTLFFMSLPLMLWDAWGETGWKNTLIYILLQEEILSVFILMFSVLLVTEIPLIALKFKEYSWKNNRIRYILIGLSLILIVLLSFRAIPVILILYLGLSMVENWRR